MIPGYNHNIKYQDRIYHVQTEDNGLNSSSIVSHIFLGGNVLATKKVSYRDIATNENAPQIIREMMKELHKTMVKELVNGLYDHQLPHPAPPAPAPAVKVVDKKTSHPPKPPDFDADKAVDSEKSLDEIILDYLSKESQ